MYSLSELPKLIAEWVESPEGKESMRKTAEEVRQMNIKAEQDKRDFALWWAANKDRPTTI